MGGSSSTQRNSASKGHGHQTDRSLSAASPPPRKTAPRRRRDPRQMTRSASTDNLPTTDKHEPRRSPQRDDIRTWIAEARARQRQRNSDTILAASGGLAWTVELESTQINMSTNSHQTTNSRADQLLPPRRRNVRRMARSTSNDSLPTSRTTQQPESRSPLRQRRRNGRQLVRSTSTEHLPTPRTTVQQRSSPRARNRAMQQARSPPLRAAAQRSSNVSTPRTSQQPGRRAGRQVVRSNSSENLPTSRATEQPRTRSPRTGNVRQVIRTSSNEHLPTSRQRRSPPIRSRAFQPVRRSPPASGPIRTARRVVRSSNNENVSTSSRTAQRRRVNPVGRNVRRVVQSTSNENLPTSRPRRSGERDSTRAWIAEARSRARSRETEDVFVSGGVSWTIEVDGQTNTTRKAEEPSCPEAILPEATLHESEAPPTYQEAVTSTYKSLSYAPAITTPGKTQQRSETETGDQVPPPLYSDAWK